MTVWIKFIRYIIEHHDKVLLYTEQHLYISMIALALGFAFCLPVGIWLTRHERYAPIVIGAANVAETIPSLALLGFLIFIFGIGDANAIAALFLYSLLPMLQNTYTGIKNVDRSLIEAGRGMGMTDWQILTMVELPLARPVIVAGVRVASVWTIGTATLAAAIGGGGLGRLIFAGLATIRDDIMLAGAVPAALLALLADWTFAAVERWITPRGLRVQQHGVGKAKARRKMGGEVKA
ncbi:MAG: ABC transporter permease [Bacillota bacterium]